MKTKIEKFLQQFPKDATCWSKATDEIRDLSRWSRELLEEKDGVIVEPVDFNALKTPADWNTKGRESIIANFDRMTPATRQEFYNQNREWFDSFDPKEWERKIAREKLIQEITDLHAKAKKTEYGSILTTHVQLVGHILKQPIQHLEDMKRLFEGILETSN